MAGTDAQQRIARGNGGERADFEAWPDWDTSHVSSLARYVSVAALDEIGLPSPAPYTVADADWTSGASIAHEVYENIRQLGLRYMHEPWRVAAFKVEAIPLQRVRYPAWIRRDTGGTCLDLAILYATALMRAQIRPYIAVMYGPSFSTRSLRGERQGHAFVVADLREPLTVQRDLGAGSEPSALEQVEPGCLGIRTREDWPPYLLAIDPMYATTDFPLTATETSPQSLEFAQAVEAGSSYLGNQSVQLCDVAVAQDKHLHPPLPRPADTATPAIWTRLPDMLTATRYPSREEQYGELMAARGRIVIWGHQGFGKSTLAYERARKADGGYGWFLNAADRSALQSELAQAEIEQTSRGYRQPLERLDLVPFSEAAVRRLEVSDAPWVLVLDNANGDPGDLVPLLPRTMKTNQTVIVTTTNEAWLTEWPASVAAHIRLAGLEPGDMRGLPDELHRRVGGSPLFYEAARAAVESGARVPAQPETDAGLSWQLAQEFLAGEPGALDLAHLLAWAPPVALPTAGFAPFFECAEERDDGPDRLGRLLERAGLVRFLTRPVPALLMHRLIAARIRKDRRLIRVTGQESLPAPVALLAADAGQRLMTDRGDDESFSRLEAKLSSERPAQVLPRRWGLAVYGIARAGEIRGRSGPSSELFEKAITLLDETPDRPLLSECWNGRARYLKDHPPADRAERMAVLADALSWAVRAQDLAGEAAASTEPGSDQYWWDLIRAERAHAMVALIIKTQARDITDPDEQRAQYARSLEMLEISEEKRGKYLAELGIDDSPDTDRSKFNLGGPCISLAKLSRGGEAEDYLRRGLRAYEEAKQIRVERHGAGVALPSIASCDNGIALVYLYGALLGADPQRAETEAFRPVSPQTRMTLLRRAGTACAEALRDRTTLAPADRDDGDAIKSDDLTIKIAATRKFLTAVHTRDGEPATEADARKLLDKVIAETLAEARDLGGIVRPARNDA